MLLIVGFLSCLGLLISHQTAFATNPSIVSFQGKVVNADGTNVTNGSYNFDFVLYDDPSLGSPSDGVHDKWHELTKSVSVTNGVFQTNLGSATALPDFNANPSLYLAVRFNADAAGYMTPRVQLGSVPYASNSDKVGGVAASSLVQLGATQSGNINLTSGTFTGTLTVQGATALTLGAVSSHDGAIVFDSSGGTNTVTLQAPTTNPTSAYTLKLPTAAPALSQCLQNDGTTIGQLTFAACSAGGGDSITVNGSAATDANFIDTTATSTVAGTSFTLNTAPTPDTIALSVGNASTTVAGVVTAAAQSFAGNKTFQSTTNSATAFQVQNASSAPILLVDTTTLNLITNPGFETGTTGWTGAGTGASCSQNTATTNRVYYGLASLKCTTATSGSTTATVSSFTGSIPAGNYAFSFYAMGDNAATLASTVSFTGGSGTCTLNSTAILTTGFQRYSCTITTTGATTAIVITTATNNAVIYVDSVQLTAGSTVTPYKIGAIQIRGILTTPASFQATSQSTTAFQILDSAGTSLLNVDSLNGGLTFAGDTTLNGQKDLRFADSDSSNWVAFQAPATVASNVTWTLPSADSAGCFKSDGSGTLSLATCGDVKTETVASTGTWTKPTGSIVTIVEAWGGGGSGAAGQAANVATAAKLGGGAGGGGAYNTASFASSNIGGTVEVTIGAGATGGTGVAGGNGNVGAAGGQTCFSTTTACAGTMYITAFGGGGGAAAGVGNGGGGGGGIQGVGGNTTTTAGGTGGAPTATAANTANVGYGGAGGAVAAVTPAAAGAGAFGGGGGGATSTTSLASNDGGPGGGSNHGGGGGGGGGGCVITTCVLRNGGAGGAAGKAANGVAGGSSLGAVGTAGTNGIGFGGGGGGGGASNNVLTGSTGGAGGAGGTQGGGGGGGGGVFGTSGSSTGGAGGAGGKGEVRITSIKGTGADLAEIYSTKDDSIGSGDVVSLDPSLKAGVMKSSKAYDSTAFGIISTTPSLVMGALEDEGATPVMVALTGRVPVKVNLQNGPILPGDFLTPSSTPGVAMKATKAGQVVAQAMIGFDGTSGDNTGLIAAFVKNQVGNGSKLSDLVTGVSPIGDDTAVPDISKLALAQLVTVKDQLVGAVDLSEVTTDRVTAGLEVITPKVTTNELNTNTIKPATANDLSVELGAGNKFVVKGQDGSQSFSIDSSGNAQFALSLVSLGTIESRGGLVVNGESQFNGKSTFAALAQFLNDVSLQGNVDASGRVTFNKDAGGFAVIKKAATRVDVTFAQQYASLPIVTASLQADQTTLNDGTKEDIQVKEQRLLDAGYNYLVSNVSTKGFTIVLNKKSAEDIKFSWSAVAINDQVTTEGQPNPNDSGQ